MGLVVGLASILGTLAGASSQLVSAIMLTVALAAIGYLARTKFTRRTLALASGVCLLSAIIASLDHPVEEPISTTPGETAMRAEIRSDPRVAGQGSSAEIGILSGMHSGRTTLAFFPASFRAVKGTEVAIAGEFPDATGAIFFVEQARVMQRPGELARLRGEIRSGLVNQVQLATPGSPGTLTVGLLTGDDSALTPAERDNLRESGLSHITAVSGWNVTIIVGTVALVFRAAGLRGRFWTVVQIAGILFYVWLVGLQPPIVRAAIMGSIALLATWFGRPAHMMTLLVLSAAVMAALDPVILWSVSFQLSFLAMVGLAVTSVVTGDNEGPKRALMIATLAPVLAAIATAPLIAAHFGMISFLTVPANIIVAPLISPMALMGFLGAALSTVNPFLGVLPGSVAWFLGSIVLAVAGLAGWFPGASATFRPPEAGVVVGVYMLLLLGASPWIPEIRYLIRRRQEALARWDSGSVIGLTSFGIVLVTGWLVL